MIEVYDCKEVLGNSEGKLFYGEYNYTMCWSEMKNEKKLIMFLQKQDYIKSAYLFGSAAKEKTGKLSDIDIGVLLDESLAKEDLLNLKLNLISEIISILGTDKIDLTVMNNAPVSLNYEIIKANKPLFVRNKTEKVEFEHQIMLKYLDRCYYDKRHSKLFLKKVAERGLSF